MKPPPLPHTGNLASQDDEHLDLLGIFHFVMGGLSVAFTGLVGLHFLVMEQFVMAPPMGGGGLPTGVFQIFAGFYVVAGVICLGSGVANVLSGLFLRRKRHRTFSLVIAVINCFNVPLGTILGIFTLLVLQRESVRHAYALAVPPHARS